MWSFNDVAYMINSVVLPWFILYVCVLFVINLLSFAKGFGLLYQVCATMPSTSTVSADGSKPAKCALLVRGRECIWFLRFIYYILKHLSIHLALTYADNSEWEFQKYGH